MTKLGENTIGACGLPPFFEVANPSEMGISAPENRKGDALRTFIHSLSGFQKEALVTSARTGATWRLVSDEGAYLNGHDAAPCPLAFLTTGMISSYMNEILALARKQNVEIRKLKLIQDNYYTMKGSMLKRTMIGGAEPVELTVEIDCGLDDGELGTFLANAIHASPLNGLMREQLDSLFKLSKNGQELPTARVAEMKAPLLRNPVELVDTVAAKFSDLTLLESVGPTPKKDVAKGTSESGSSLASEQDRRLNIGAIATLREDGIKEIQQMTYSPYGTNFCLLSEEAPVNGGHGRAPDAYTYISAGIGFCFMTQFGRFVEILKLDLPKYQILQDTHFSLGGASGDTGKAGTADPVETHVYLETSEPDSMAQEMLDISEQTCFLHALCRSELKTRLRVKRA
ncbi:OsmC family protein [Parahaliea mediterranea]|uniref:OsmC family protein n=1 Tax=Parahaliea mediterranea TaxID=651086 RepID=A0A939DG01_9GAMM|nr:OsmC family protein [Parahaliea mediterranea]MBN7797600.1 OsmC family protein [Parahaliea mediterranea]